MDLPLLGEREINLNISRAMLTLLGSGVESKITFSGMPQQGRYDNSADNPEHNVIVLDEEYSYKQINSGNLDQFIKNFGSRASYQGLMDIISLPDEIINSISKVSIVDVTVSTYSYGTLNYSDNKATATQNVTATYRYMNPEWPTQEINESYPQMVNTVNAIYNVLCSKSMSFLGVDVILAGPGGIIPNQYALIHFLRDAKINAELGTMEEGPRLVFWGLDAKGPDVIVPAE